MKFVIKHEMRGRLRIHFCRKRLTFTRADELAAVLAGLPGVSSAKIYERTADAVIWYSGGRRDILERISRISEQDVPPAGVIADGRTRELNAEFKEKLICRALIHFGKKIFLPSVARAAWTVLTAVRYIRRGLQVLRRGRLEVEVLDATAVTVSILRADFDTASSIMFLLGVGELLEEWTHKKSVSDLAHSMSLNVTKVWKKTDEGESFVDVGEIQKDDRIIIHVGNMIPLDGIVSDGEAMVNQASMTGESVPVRKTVGSYVYAGTAIEEGKLCIQVKQTVGATRYERVVRMIEESEKLKSTLEGKAATLADALVPWSLGGTLLTWLITRNTTRALSILMVDFSCALKLAMPLAVLSAIREAQLHHITVKGGKFLEAVADADTIVFDKTGTLTKAQPEVAQIVTFEQWEENDMLRVAACLEEHFPHSVANAVVRESVRRGLVHEEMHSRVEYIVAHGIATYIGEDRVVIGSYHFVFEDEQCVIPEGEEEKFRTLPENYSYLHLAVGGRLAAVICIEDPLREEACAVIEALHGAGIAKLVMMTGDSERTARAIAAQVGVDEYYSEVLPEDKAAFVEKEKAAGRRVIMIGDGINDSPALSAADVGIAVSEGAEIAREIADITISADDLRELVTLKRISDRLMGRIGANYRFVISFNLMLILLGVAGILTPSASALLHNTSTLAISLRSMTNLLETA
ncbi:MAG: heavy metal translocating P-type ATPase [Clostridiales bacterium]|nr:heavy metal translocating P-type ATPase [Clostridiales bacterium]